MKRNKYVSMVRNKSAFILLWLLATFIIVSCSLDLLQTKSELDPEVSKLLQVPVSAESYPEAGIVYLLDEAVEEIKTNGNVRLTIHQVIAIISERGKDEANREIGYNARTENVSLLYARTISPQGAITPLKKNAMHITTPYSEYPSYGDYQELTFSLPAVEVGSVIDYKYVIEKRPHIKGEFANYFYVQACSPVLFSRYKIITPVDMNVHHLLKDPLKDAQQSPTITEKGGKTVYLWEHRDVPQILKEEYMPPEVGFTIYLTTMDSWSPFITWWRHQIEGKTNSNRAIKAEVSTLTKGLLSTREKTEALFDYVKRKIRYVAVDLGKSGYEPTSAQEVFENRYGDCKDQSTLLISMLREAGIPAYYVLLPTANKEDLIEDFPYPFQFNHCIVAVDHGAGYWFLDPTDKYYRFPYLPDGDQNRGILIFNDNETHFARSPLAEPQDNATIVEQTITIRPDHAIEVATKRCGSGFEDSFLRYLYLDHSPLEIKEWVEGVIDNIAPGARLLELTHTDPLDFKKQCVERRTYYAPDYCKKAGDILIFPVPSIEKSCEGTDKKERRYPLVYDSTSCRKDQVAFTIPDGYEIYYLPEPTEIQNPYFAYHASFEQKGETVFYQGTFMRTAVRIPTEKYAQYRKLCQAMEKSCKRYVLFREKKR